MRLDVGLRTVLALASHDVARMGFSQVADAFLPIDRPS